MDSGKEEPSHTIVQMIFLQNSGCGASRLLFYNPLVIKRLH